MLYNFGAFGVHASQLKRHKTPLHEVFSRILYADLVFPEIFQAYAWGSYRQSRGYTSISSEDTRKPLSRLRRWSQPMLDIAY